MKSYIPPAITTYPLSLEEASLYEMILSVDRCRGANESKLVATARGHLARHKTALRKFEAGLKQRDEDEGLKQRAAEEEDDDDEEEDDGDGTPPDEPWANGPHQPPPPPPAGFA